MSPRKVTRITDVPPSARLVVVADWTPGTPPTALSVADTDPTSGEAYWTVKLATPGCAAGGVMLASTSPAGTSAIVSSGRSSLRSEEHTSELQSLMRISYAVFCLKKKQDKTKNQYNQQHMQ